MDQVLPAGMMAAIEGDRGRRQRRAPLRHVLADGRRHEIVALGPEGFVVGGDDAARLRGFVDIMEGDLRIARRLVVCAWAQDGLVGYEYKSEGAVRPVATDYAAPDPERLVEGPRD